MSRFIGITLLALAALVDAQGGQQHVGDSARKKRDEVLKSREDVQRREYDASKGSYDHLPVLKFHHGGQMDLASLTVVGTKRHEPDPYGTEALWVEDEKGKVVFLQEEGVHGGFAVAPHLKLPGVKLTTYNLDDEGLWVGATVDVPSSVPPKQEL